MSGTNYREGQNVCSDTCPIRHIESPAAIQEPSGSWPDIRGLNSLNYSRTAWITGDAVEVALTTYKRGLPQLLQDKIDIVIPGLDPKVWYSGDVGDQALTAAIARPARRALNRMKRTEYSFLPICTDGNHWVLAIVHKTERHILDKPGTIEYSHIAQVAVLDSFRDTARVDMVHSRLEQWLRRAGRFTINRTVKQVVWVPAQVDATSCGPRVYWNAKQIMDRLLVLHEYGIDYDAWIWCPLSGWFNEDFVRGEMVGRCAWEGVRAMDYKARVSIECVDEVRNYEDANAGWEPADEVMTPVSGRSSTPQKRPRKYKGFLSGPDGSYSIKSATLKPSADAQKYVSEPPEADLSNLDGIFDDHVVASMRPQQPHVPIMNQHALVPASTPAVEDSFGHNNHDEDLPLSPQFRSPRAERSLGKQPAVAPAPRTTGAPSQAQPNSSSNPIVISDSAAPPITRASQQAQANSSSNPTVISGSAAPPTTRASQQAQANSRSNPIVVGDSPKANPRNPPGPAPQTKPTRPRGTPAARFSVVASRTKDPVSTTPQRVPVIPNITGTPATRVQSAPTTATQHSPNNPPSRGDKPATVPQVVARRRRRIEERQSRLSASKNLPPAQSGTRTSAGQPAPVPITRPERPDFDHLSRLSFQKFSREIARRHPEHFAPPPGQRATPQQSTLTTPTGSTLPAIVEEATEGPGSSSPVVPSSTPSRPPPTAATKSSSPVVPSSTPSRPPPAAATGSTLPRIVEEAPEGPGSSSPAIPSSTPSRPPTVAPRARHRRVAELSGRARIRKTSLVQTHTPEQRTPAATAIKYTPGRSQATPAVNPSVSSVTSSSPAGAGTKRASSQVELPAPSPKRQMSSTKRWMNYL